MYMPLFVIFLHFAAKNRKTCLFIEQYVLALLCQERWTETIVP